MGIGPSAHSYDGEKRGWNVSNNALYIKSISDNKVPIEIETLTKTDRYNEYIMTGLRTIWGISLDRIAAEFGESYLNYLNQQAAKYIEDKLLCVNENILRTTKNGKFLSDGIASDLFLLNLE
jgi:oxygen-independent coproporphyrinogen III oxidase